MYADVIHPVEIGRIGAPYGVRGWVRVHSDTQPADNILDYGHWLLETAKGWQQQVLEKVKPHGNSFVAKFQGVDDRDQAALITNSKIAVHRDALPELEQGEHYWTDLLGLEVITDEGIRLGVITDFFETGANDVLVVKGEKEHLVPYVPDEYVLAVDREQKTMTVRWDLEL